MNRREFVEAISVGGGACLALAGCASLVTHSVTPVDGVIRLSTINMPDLAKAGGAVRIQPAGLPEPVYVLRSEDAGQPSYFAVSPICTHRGCTVETQGAVLVCPCHGSTFARSGAVLRGPAERPLRSYPATATTEGVEIDLRGAGR